MFHKVEKKISENRFLPILNEANEQNLIEVLERLLKILQFFSK